MTKQICEISASIWFYTKKVVYIIFTIFHNALAHRSLPCTLNLCHSKKCNVLSSHDASRWGARYSAPVQTGSEAHPASYKMGAASFSGVKRPKRGVDHPPPI